MPAYIIANLEVTNPAAFAESVTEAAPRPCTIGIML